ncbi:Protein CAF40 [Glycine soja]|uniref:Protein CAF40 n=1 Tax=Glycine soja TaxID=3848 RepID=A0A445LAH2_GLYSO|nr:hypothetical protein JHK87_007010 [Glycine soja]RZC20160.1 Protein CAF40 [Glycine soja]
MAQLQLETHIPIYLYPFLNTTRKSRLFEYLRLTTLGVIGALVKYASGDISSIMLWDVDKEQLVYSKSSSSDCSVSVLLLITWAMFDLHSHHNITTSGDVLATKFGWLVVLGLAVYLHHIPYGMSCIYHL